MMAFFEKLLGVRYPWSQYSQIMIDEFMYGGMENTTATTLNDYLLVDAGALVDYDPDPTIAHELAHQWYGDLVTNRSWADLWIHESYATFLENQWMRHKAGEEWYAREVELNGRDGILSDNARGRDRLVGGKGLTENVYARGARILDMLERIVGPEIFWRANRLFLERHAYGLVETNDLKIAFEDVSGMNLDWFFDEWIYGGGYPEYHLEQTIERDTLSLTVRQTQRRDSIAGLFQMPVPIEFHLAGRIVRDTIVVAKESETFRFPMKETPKFVIFDAGNTILKSVQFPRPDAAIIAQLEAPRMIDRYFAVEELTATGAKEKPAPARIAALHRRFLKEPSAYVREEIVRSVAGFDSPLVVEIIRRALADSAAAVRGEGIDQAFRITDKKERNELLLPLLRDSSRSNAASALGMLAASGTPGLVPYLMNLRGIRGQYDQTLLTWMNAVAAGGYTIFADDVADWAMPTHSRSIRTQAYSTLAYLDTITTKMLSAVEAGLRDNTASIRLTTGNVVRKHRGKAIDALLERLRDQLTGDQREYVVRLLKEEVIPGGRGHTNPESAGEREGRSP
jgi:aminopeptidase N